MTREALEQALNAHLPPAAVPACATMILEHRVHLKITRSRLSKYGDYRAPYKGAGHRISINHNLNSYTFLVTFVHEMAHLETYNEFKHQVDGHGKEWKQIFRNLLKPFLMDDIFPVEVKSALERYISNPAASSCGDPDLYKALKNYDACDAFTFLENLPEGCYFKIKGYGNVFIKGKRLRKNFHCKLKDSKREFRISSVAEVQQIGLF